MAPGCHTAARHSLRQGLPALCIGKGTVRRWSRKNAHSENSQTSHRLGQLEVLEGGDGVFYEIGVTAFGHITSVRASTLLTLPQWCKGKVYLR
jgi:hypothetical protein